MSTTIDNRVVQMRFDNEEFEKKASKSLSTLDKLKNALKFSGASKNIDKVNESFKEVDANPLLKAINGINSGFTTMVAKATLVNRATNALIDTTKRFVNSMTLDQVNAGWDKYAEKTSAVQTIMAATSKDFKDTAVQMSYVNQQLEKLNWFTDETSYNLIDMVGNIGKFTSNGIKFDKSVTAMQGIATWAARSGANANEASRAMYNLSQALSVGSVKLIDWKSIENANMATAEFKENALEAAAALGTLKKKGDGTYVTMKNNAVSVQNFNSALSDAWFTSDVLLEVLDKYGGFTNKLYEVADATDLTATQLLSAIDKYIDGTLDLQSYASATGVDIEELRGYLDELSSSTYELGRKSFKSAQEAKTFAEAISATTDAISTGWMKTFELIFGDYEEAKKLWTNLASILYEVFAASGDVRNELFGEWREGGGRKTLLEGINEAMEAILRLVKPFKDAFRDVFPAKTSQDLLNATNSFKSLMKALQLNSRQMTDIRRTMRGVFSVVDLLITAFKSCASAIGGALFPALGKANTGLLEIFGAIGDILTAVTKVIKENVSLTDSFSAIGKFAKNLITILQKLFNQIRQSTAGKAGWALVKTLLDGAVNSAAKLLKYVSEVVSRFASLDKITLSGIGSVFAGVGTDAVNYFKNLKFDIKDSDGVLASFQNAVSESCKSVGLSFEHLGNRAAGAFQIIRDWLDKVPWAAIVSIGFGISLINSLNKFINAISALGTPIGNLTKSLNGLIGSIKGMFNAITAQIKAPTYIKIAQAIALLAGSIAVLAMLPTEKLGAATVALGVTMIAFGTLVAALSSLPKLAETANASIGVIAVCVIALATSLRILANAFDVLKEVNLDDLMSTCIVIGAFITGLVVAARAMNSNITRLSDASGKIMSTNTAAKNLLAMSAAIYVIAQAIKSISNIKFEDPVSALEAIGMAVVSVIALTVTLSKIKATDGVKGAASMILAVGAVIAMLHAIERISEVDLLTLAASIPRVAIVMLELVALFAMTKLLGEHAGKAGALMAGVGLGIMLIIGAIGLLGSMKPETIEKGVNAVGYLTICMMGLMAFSKLVGSEAHKVSITLVAAAAAIAVLAIIAGIVGTLDDGQMIRGITFVGGLTLMLSLLIAATHLGKDLGKSITTLTISVVALGTMIAVLAGFTDGDKLQNVSMCLATVMGVLAIVMAVAKLAKPSLAGMAIIVAAIGALGLILGLMADNIKNVDNLIPIAQSLEILMRALVLAIAATAIAGAASALIIAGLPGLAAVVVAVGVILGLISLIDVPDDLPDKCTKIGLSIGNLIGSLLGGIVSGAFSAVEQIGQTLKTFGELMQQTDFVSISNGLTAGLDLVKLLKEIPGPSIWQVLGGEGNIEAFASQFEAFGNALKVYGASVSGCDNVAILASIPGALGLAEIANSIPDMGIFNIFTGVKSLSTFGSQLMMFGLALTAYSLVVSAANISAIEASIPAVRSLVEISNTLENSGGVISFFTGDNNFTRFGKQLKDLGTAFKDYAESIADVDFGRIQASVRGAKGLVDLSNTLPEDGLWQWLSGKQDIGDFGEKLAEFGGSMRDYYLALGNVTFVDTSKMLAHVRAIINLAPEFNDLDLSSMESFGAKMAQFAYNLQAFFSTTGNIEQPTPVRQICNEMVESINALQTYTGIFKQAGEDCLKGLIEGLTEEENLNKVRNSGKLIGDTFLNAFRDTTGWHSPWSTMVEAGQDSALGLMSGVKNSVAYEAGENLSQDMLDGFNDVIGRHSEPDEYRNAGKDCADAIVTGTENGSKEVNDAGAALSTSLLEGTSDKLESGFSSLGNKVGGFIDNVKDEYSYLGDGNSLLDIFGLGFDTSETGDGTIQQISDAISGAVAGGTNSAITSGSISASGTKAADAFLTALENRMSDLDLDISTIDLEKELWDATIGQTASESDKKAKETEILTEKIKLQNEKVNEANQKYEYTVKKMGQTSEDAKKAYQELLQEQIDLANLMNSLDESRGTATDNAADAMVAYAKYVSESQDELLKMGFTMEQISAAASERTGYNVHKTTQDMADTVTNAVATTMSNISSTYLTTAETTLGAITTNFESYGAQYTTAVGDGMTTTVSTVEDAAKTLSQKASDTASSTGNDLMYKAGGFAADGFIAGMTDKITEVAEAAAEVARSAYSAAMTAIRAASPSKLFMNIGRYADMGMIVGFEEMSSDVAKSSAEVSDSAVNAARETISQIAELIDTDPTLHPQIAPVVDLSEARSGLNKLNSFKTPTISTYVTGARVSAVASSIAQRDNNVKQVVPQNNQNEPTSVSFVQNNYSPKALSRSEIYRNTNNQFTAFKEAISKV